MQSARGFTLWELLCALTVASIVLGLGVPTFERIVLDSRQTADVNAWVLAVQVARSEAFKRHHPVILCPTADWTICSGSDARLGWMVFVNLDGIRPPERSESEPLIYAYEPESAGAVYANRAYFEFRPLFRRSTNGTVVFCDARGSTAARAVIVSYTGRPRVARRSADGKPLSCAQLP